MSIACIYSILLRFCETVKTRIKIKLHLSVPNDPAHRLLGQSWTDKFARKCGPSSPVQPMIMPILCVCFISWEFCY